MIENEWTTTTNVYERDHNYVLLIWLRIHTQLCLFVVPFICVFIEEEEKTKWNNEKKIVSKLEIYKIATMAYRQHSRSTTIPTKMKTCTEQEHEQQQKRKKNEEEFNNSYGAIVVVGAIWRTSISVLVLSFPSRVCTVIDPLFAAIRTIRCVIFYLSLRGDRKCVLFFFPLCTMAMLWCSRCS